MELVQRSLQGGILILVIVAIRVLWLDRLPKRTFPVLWCVVLVRLLAPFSVSSGASVYSFAEGAARGRCGASRYTGERNGQKRPYYMADRTGIDAGTGDGSCRSDGTGKTDADAACHLVHRGCFLRNLIPGIIPALPEGIPQVSACGKRRGAAMAAQAQGRTFHYSEAVGGDFGSPDLWNLPPGDSASGQSRLGQQPGIGLYPAARICAHLSLGWGGEAGHGGGSVRPLVQSAGLDYDRAAEPGH